MALHDFKSARKYLCRARELRPNNSEVREQLQLLIKKEESYLNREKLMCKKMISMDKKKSEEDEERRNSTDLSGAPSVSNDLLDSISECGTNVTLVDECEEKKSAATDIATNTNATASKVSANVQSAFKRIIKNFAEDSSRVELILPPNLSSDELLFIKTLANAVSIKVKKNYTDESMQWKLVRS